MTSLCCSWEWAHATRPWIRLLQLVSNFREAGSRTCLVLIAARGSAHADCPDRVLTHLDRQTTCHAKSALNDAPGRHGRPSLFHIRGRPLVGEGCVCLAAAHGIVHFAASVVAYRGLDLTVHVDH